MKGLKVSSFIIPMNPADTYPTNLDIFGKGGIHSVAETADREAITLERRSEGMLSFTKSDESMYALLGGVTNDNWIKLFDFSDNKVNLNIACDPNYVLLGNKDGVAKPSPRLRDMQYDIIDLRREIDKIGVLETLDHNRIWIGDYTNRPVMQKTIGVNNLPILGAALFPIPLLSVSIPIPNPTFDPTSGWDYVMSSPWLNQIYAGSPSLLNTSTETVVSSSLAFTQINAAQAIKRLDNAGFIVKSRTIRYNWENPIYSIVTDPLLIAAMELYGLGTTYTFTKAQALDELEGKSLLMVNNDIPEQKGTIQTATLTKDKFWLGNEQNIPIESDKFPITTLPDLAKDNIWVGDDNNRPVPYNIKTGYLSAKFILQEPNNSYSNAQALSELSTGLLKSTTLTGVISIASGGDGLLDDYVTPLALLTQKTELEFFATEAAADAAAGAVVISNAKLDFEMLPYAPIPLYTYGLQISNDIGNRTDEVRNLFIDQMKPYSFNMLTTYGQQIKEDIQNAETRTDTKIDNLTVNLVGDISGSNNIKNQIITSFTPNPNFKGKSYMKIPTGNTSERPSVIEAGMIRYNTEL